MKRNKEFLYENCEIEKKKLQQPYNFQKQNYKHNISRNCDADALFHHSDHCKRDDTVFLKVVLQYAQNCATTETIL